MHRPIALGSQDMRKGKEGQYITLVTRRTVETNSKAVGHHPEIRVDIAHFTIWFVRIENLGLRIDSPVGMNAQIQKGLGARA